MVCHKCSSECKKFGRFGPEKLQRYRCKQCGKTFSEDPGRLLGDLRIEERKGVLVLRLLCEGMSVRGAARLADCHPDTVLALLEVAGRKCQRLLENKLTHLTVPSVEIDELWARVGCRQRMTTKTDRLRGDFYTFIAMDARTKLIISHFTGKRDGPSTDAFVADLASRIHGITQVSSDCWAHYPTALRDHMLYRLNYATVQKVYAHTDTMNGWTRIYEPPHCTHIVKEVRAGAPDPDKISTSHIERLNLSCRMFNRRFARLTPCYSRKLANHRHSVSLFVAHYNFCRVHSTTGCTPAMGSKITSEAWSVERLLTEGTRA